MLEKMPRHTKVVHESHTCDFHKRNPFKRDYAGCTCSGSWVMQVLTAPEPLDPILESLKFDMTHVYRAIKDSPQGVREVGNGS